MWPPDLTSLLLVGVVLSSLWWWLSTRRPRGLLPLGPGLALPLLGHLHLLAKDPRAQFMAWKRQYGDVFSLYMGGRLVVVLASYSAIHEAFVTMADAFSGRPRLFTVDHIFQNKGIALSSGQTWKEQRKTAVTILRALGMGKNVLAEKIQEEISNYTRAIRNHQGAPMDLVQMTQASLSSNTCSMIFGKRYDYQDSELIECIQHVRHNVELLSGTAVLNFLPALRYLPCDPFKGRDIMASSESVFSFIDRHVEEHREAFGESGLEARDDTDFLHAYLRQIQECKARGDVNSSVNEENLQKVLLEMFVAGSETVASTLSWALLFLLHHPHVQDKCFQELCDVVGPRGVPTMQDKPNLPYLDATICEVLRKGDINPFALWHATAHDVTFRGYAIPKDTVVLPSLSGLMQDQEVWGDPENFRPERFVGADGKGVRPEEFIPFSVGRRACLGKSVGRMQLFLYLANLIQQFHFLPPEEGQLPSLEGVFGITHTTKPFKIRAQPRM